MNTRFTRMFLVALPAAALLTVCPARAEEAAAPEPTVSVTPLVRYVHVDGNEDLFRQHLGMTDGWAGGVEEFSVTEALGKNWQLVLSGRGIFEEQDYQLQLELVNPAVGFVRAGYREYRTYYNDVGGSYAPFSTSAFKLHKDLDLRHGDLFIELGLTLPNLPQITVGYERQFRDGEKSLLEWGNVQEGATNRRIFPSYKQIDEVVDIFKARLEFDLKNIRVADQFRYEHYRNDTERTDLALSLNNGATKTTVINEQYSHDAFYNTFTMDSHLNEKVYWSLGYLYNSTSGDGGLSLDTTPFNAPLDQQLAMQALDVELDSNVVNFNTMFGPFAGLTINLGLQAENTRTEGASEGLLNTFGSGSTAIVTDSNNDKNSLEEIIGLRYTKIPFTTLYAEARWTEQQLDLSERETSNSTLAFRRQTDTDVFRQDYRLGFNSSPLAKITLGGRYRHSINDNDYDHSLDTIGGYPAHITGQDFTTDEVMARIGWRPCAQFNTAFTYQFVSTRTETATAGVPLLAPQGSRQSGEYDASIYSLSATIAPVTRLYLTALLSLQDAQTATFDNGAASLSSYEGNVYSVLGMAGYALTEKVDLTVEYLWSQSDNYSNKTADGLPLGLDFRRQGISAGLTMKLAKNVVGKLGYGYFTYDENHAHGINDYKAHLASGSVTVRF
jgi:hypothetical protein